MRWREGERVNEGGFLFYVSVGESLLIYDFMKCGN